MYKKHISFGLILEIVAEATHEILIVTDLLLIIILKLALYFILIVINSVLLMLIPEMVLYSPKI